jgi:4a-hydroxytetrahydrobiopterin dehydratase
MADLQAFSSSYNRTCCLRLSQHLNLLLTAYPRVFKHIHRYKPCLSSVHTAVRPLVARYWARNISGPSDSNNRELNDAPPSVGKTSESEESKWAEVIIAPGQPAELQNRLAKLSAEWSVTPDRMGIKRHFEFYTFNAAWLFMGTVSNEIKIKKHHPNWSNNYSTVIVEWTTHRPRGVSMKDVEMAELCDEVAGKSTPYNLRRVSIADSNNI